MTNAGLNSLRQWFRGERAVVIITPDLVNEMNQIEGLTQEFDKTWDAAVDALETHNKKLCEDCPAGISKFIKQINLFDCPVHSRSRMFANDEYPLVVGDPSSNSVYSLHYEILHEPVILQHSGAGFDNAQKANWLYDEFHKVENHYEHHILFSDGVEMQIPFIFFFHRTQTWFEE